MDFFEDQQVETLALAAASVAAPTTTSNYIVNTNLNTVIIDGVFI